jgi:hypothetical protein
MSELLGPRREIPDTFDATRYPKPLSPEDSYVKIGDRVRLLGRASQIPSATRESTRPGPTGQAPNQVDKDRLDAALIVLEENGIEPGVDGYDVATLQSAVFGRGWYSETEAINGAWDATVRKETSPGITQDFKASLYWDEASALAVALQLALLDAS